MDNNAIMRRLRYALNLDDPGMIEVLAQDGCTVGLTEIAGMLKKEEEEGYQICSDEIMGHFLDGLIIQRRGKREPVPGKAPVRDPKLNNNLILKKIRIALELKEEDMIGTFTRGGFPISKSELSALFRKEGHRHYRPCGDQMLRKFLKGLSTRG